MKDILKIRQNGLIRYGVLLSIRGGHAVLSRRFPSTDSEGNIEGFDDHKIKRDPKNRGAYIREEEIMVVPTTNVAKARTMVLNLHYGFYEPRSEQ